MKYTGKHRTAYSAKYGCISILEYHSTHSVPYCECSRCGKPIRRTMFVVQDSKGIEVEFLGSECVKMYAE